MQTVSEGQSLQILCLDFRTQRSYLSQYFSTRMQAILSINWSTAIKLLEQFLTFSAYSGYFGMYHKMNDCYK